MPHDFDIAVTGSSMWTEVILESVLRMGTVAGKGGFDLATVSIGIHFLLLSWENYLLVDYDIDFDSGFCPPF